MLKGASSSNPEDPLLLHDRMLPSLMLDEAKSLRLCREILRAWSKQSGVRYVPPVFRGSFRYKRWKVDYSGLYVYDPRPRIFLSRESWHTRATEWGWKHNLETLAHEFVHHLQYSRSGMNWRSAFPLAEFKKEHCKRKYEGEAKRMASHIVDDVMLRIERGEISLLPRDARFEFGELPEHKSREGYVFEGWHSSSTGELGISDPEKSTEGVGYYIALERATAEFFGRIVIPASITLYNPLDARGEPPYLLHEMDEVMEPPRPGDSEWLSAVKEAVSRSGTTEQNWGRNQARLNQALTDVLQERGYDGILIENWAVKFASPEERAKLKGALTQKFDDVGRIREVAKKVRASIDAHSAEIKAGRCIISSRVMAEVLKREGYDVTWVCGGFEGNAHCWVEVPINDELYIVDVVASDFNRTPEDIRLIKESPIYTDEYKSKVTVKELPAVIVDKKSVLRKRYKHGWEEGETVPLDDNQLYEIHWKIMHEIGV